MPAHRVFIGVGSNIEPETHIPEAAAQLNEHSDVLRCSTFYRSPAVGRPELPDFVNGVFEIESELEPQSLKSTVLQPIEDSLGRVRSADAYGSRTIDLDILLHGTAVMQCGDMTLPDPEIRTRVFVAVPLLELSPDITLPDTGEALRDLPILKDMDTLTEVPAFRAQVLARIEK